METGLLKMSLLRVWKKITL